MAYERVKPTYLVRSIQRESCCWNMGKGRKPYKILMTRKTPRERARLIWKDNINTDLK